MNHVQSLTKIESDAQSPWLSVRRYLVALSFVGIAFLVEYWVSPFLGEELPFILFIAAALLAAWHAGAAAGIAALLLGLLLADHFFLRDLHPQDPRNPVFNLLLIRYLFTASLGIALIEVQHRARRRTEKALQEVRHEVALREQSEAARVLAEQQLREHATQLENRVNERTAAMRATVASLQDVLYNIAHHLRAPLRAMSGFSEILVEQYGPKLDDRGREMAGNISRAAARMDTLAHDLLEYGRLAHIEIHLKEVHLADAVIEAMAHLSQSLRASHAEVIMPDSLPVVSVDPTLLQR